MKKLLAVLTAIVAGVSALFAQTVVIENVQRDNVQCTKVLRDGQLLIERDVNIYTITGQQIK